MNQILFSEQPKKEIKEKADIHKIMQYFCIFLIVFGLVMIGTGTYAFFSEKEKEIPIDFTMKPQAVIERVEDSIMITVNHNQPINYIRYKWNGEEDFTIQGNGRTNIAETIELIPGNNVLNLTVVDASNNQTNYVKEFSYVTGEDIEKPKVVMEPSGNNVMITATDETEMASLQYYWGEEEPTLIEAEEGEMTIEATVEVRKGINSLTVVAEDTSGNTETVTKTYNGITKPEINVVREGNSLIINVTDEDGIQYVDVDLNDQRYRLNMEDKGKKLTYTFEMVNGNNVLKVIAYNINGYSSTFDGESQL